MIELPTCRLVLIAQDLHRRGGMDRVHAELIKSLSHTWDIAVVSATLPPEVRDLVNGIGYRCLGAQHRLGSHASLSWLGGD